MSNLILQYLDVFLDANEQLHCTFTEFKAQNSVGNLSLLFRKALWARLIGNIPLVVMGNNAFAFKKFMNVWELEMQGIQTSFIVYTWSALRHITAPKLSKKKFKINLEKSAI